MGRQKTKNNPTIEANNNTTQTTKIEKFLRNKETRVSNPKLMVINAWWTKQNQRGKEKLPSYEKETLNKKNNKYKTNTMEEKKGG